MTAIPMEHGLALAAALFIWAWSGSSRGGTSSSS
jgi:hypothetical protein